MKNLAAILLAAGASSRFGQEKLLLPWKNKPLIWHVGRTISVCRFSQVVVVTGKNPDPIYQALADFTFENIINKDWAMGQSTSIKAGMNTLNNNIQAVMFFVGDQPKVSVPLIQHVIENFDPVTSDIVVPVSQNVKGNPVLFAHSTFVRLRNLTGDVGGRSIFPEFRVNFVEWNHHEAFMDIDTESDYFELTGGKLEE